MEQNRDNIKPRQCADAEYRLLQNLRQSYRRRVIMTDATQYFAISLLLVAVSALVLATCFSHPDIASSSMTHGGHLVQLFEKSIPA